MLWILDHVEQLNPADVLALLPHVSEPRRARILAMKNEAAQVRSILAELLLRCALRMEYGLTDLPRIGFGEKGKPFFPDRPDLHFNLSHCKTAAACALDRSPVGVDVQELRPLKAFPMMGRRHRASPASPMTDEAAFRTRTTPPVYRILSDAERAWVEAVQTPKEQDRRFTAVWTCKEAWGKATGAGFLYDLRSTDFRPTPGTWQQYGCLFKHLQRDGTFLTLCTETPLPSRIPTFSELIQITEPVLEA